MSTWSGKNGPLLIAEIGGNHEGNFEYAKELCRLAIASGTDVVKFQIYTGDTLVSPVESPDRNKHFKRFELTPQQHIELAKMVLDAGLQYTASVWDVEALEWIDPYIGFYKIGSGDLTAYPVIAEIVKRKKPIIISTGLATEQEVLDAVAYIQSLDERYKKPENFGILQCTSMYPIEHSDANLNVMLRLKELTGLAVGYSDHTTDSKAMQYAYAMGAEILEFHFTDQKEGREFRDHKVSLTKEDVQELVKELNFVTTLKGSFTKQPTAIEVETNHIVTFRRAVYPKSAIKAGEKITADHLVCLRPNHGMDAREYSKIVGKTATQDLVPFAQIQNEQLS
jgi:N,N'-diacetyllegionaminate synthase